MAKQKLEMVPAGQTTKFAAESAGMKSVSNIMGGLITTEPMPSEDTVERLNLPPMLDMKMIPIGGMVSGALQKIVENFTGRSDMRKARLLQVKHKSGTEFLIPLTGVIKNALKSLLVPDDAAKKIALGLAKDAKDKAEIELLDYYRLDPESVGRTIYIKRTADSSSKKYGGKTMFMFDVLLSKV
jgi:hypothetical protein